MQVKRFLNLALLSTLVAGAAVSYAQDEKKQDEKPAKQEEEVEAKQTRRSQTGASEWTDSRHARWKAGSETGGRNPRDSARRSAGKSGEETLTGDRAKEMDTHGEKQGQDHPERAGQCPTYG